jgi:hypothetical protein
MGTDRKAVKKILSLFMQFAKICEEEAGEVQVKNCNAVD